MLTCRLPIQNLDPIDRRKNRSRLWVLVGGDDLLDGNQLSVARTAVAHAGSVDFCRLTPPEGERATTIRRPRTVIVTDDGLGFAVAKCDVVDGHGRIPSVASMLFARPFWLSQSAPSDVRNKGYERAFRARLPARLVSGRCPAITPCPVAAIRFAEAQCARDPLLVEVDPLRLEFRIQKLRCPGCNISIPSRH